MIRAATNSGNGMSRRTVTFLIAALLALGTGFLTFSYLSSVNRTGGVVATPRIIVVAARDIPARAAITLDMLSTVRRPADAVDSDSIAVPATAVGSIARVTIPSGSAVTASKIGRAFDAGLTERIPRGMRAISIPIDKVKGVANFIQAGDHVDVIALTRAGPGTPPQALTILRNTVVLAIGSTDEPATIGASTASPAPDSNITTATLEVTPKQADLLALADVNTTLRLDLRQPKEPTDSAGVDTLVLTALPTPALNVKPAPAGAGAAPRALRTSRPISPVLVIDGDHVAGVR
jgi:pilus assembly protein CpaB